ncbi:uncharacterized protein LOC112213193 [Bombus impatiens]|uniref:Uncharacterized protein LOC112213193 n=1 Tax=Bombus impatiens TaxID=132113 RepID=A0A6P6FDC1_BOMIM|nr:uncharacterized protein LOC112213193 [Bombus impatiens]
MRRYTRPSSLAAFRDGWSRFPDSRCMENPGRPLQCYKCLEIGHVSKTCTSKEDKGHLCYRCGKPGHQAKACTAGSLLCEALEAPSVHRMGGPACPRPPKKGTKGATRGSTAASDNEKGSPSQGEPTPVNKEAGTEEAIEVTTLRD